MKNIFKALAITAIITAMFVVGCSNDGYGAGTGGGDNGTEIDSGKGGEIKNSDVEINERNFPDENFRAHLHQYYGRNGVIAAAEIPRITIMLVSDKNITDLTGIEHFTALKSLYCFNNQLTSLDVSKNMALKTLFCDNNQLTSLDVSKNTALESLSCSDNQLIYLDVSKNTALTFLSCFNNQLTFLDVSKNTALKSLRCFDNQLTSLDVSKNIALETLYCNNNQLTSLDVSQNTALTSLMCLFNNIPASELPARPANATLWITTPQNR